MIQKFKTLRHIPKSIWGMGWTTLLMNISAVIFFTLMPLFMKNVVGISAIGIGFLESIAEPLAIFMRMIAGVISDYIGRRKRLIVAGYALIALSRPILAIATNIGFVYAGRFLDRIGNGIQASPRDALVGDLTPPDLKGTSYSLRQALGTAGSLLGSILTIALMWYTHNNFATLFWIAIIPAVLAIAVLIYYVHDHKPDEIEGPPIERHTFKKSDIKKFTKHYWLAIGVSVIYHLSNYSGVFLIWRGDDVGLPTYLAPLIMVTQNFSYTLIAYPMGRLSDSISRYYVIGIGFSLMVIANIFLATSTSIFLMLGGVFLWGLQMGIMGLFLAIIADTCPADMKGTAFGVFHLISGIALFFCNNMAGYLWHHYSSSATFFASASLSVLGFIVSLVLALKESKK